MAKKGDKMSDMSKVFVSDFDKKLKKATVIQQLMEILPGAVKVTLASAGYAFAFFGSDTEADAVVSGEYEMNGKKLTIRMSQRQKQIRFEDEVDEEEEKDVTTTKDSDIAHAGEGVECGSDPRVMEGQVENNNTCEKKNMSWERVGNANPADIPSLFLADPVEQGVSRKRRRLDMCEEVNIADALIVLGEFVKAAEKSADQNSETTDSSWVGAYKDHHGNIVLVRNPTFAAGIAFKQ